MLNFLKSLRRKLTFCLCLGTLAYPSQVQALGYEQGIHSIHAFESSIDAFEKEDLAALTPVQQEVLYCAATQLLFDVSAKIIQCKIISRATGYPLYYKDLNKYSNVRYRTERLVSQLCSQNKDLDPIPDMQGLENACCHQTHNDTFQDCFLSFVEGLGQGAMDVPGHVVSHLKTAILLPITFTSWIIDTASDDYYGSPQAKRKIRNYVNKVHNFKQSYEKEGFPLTDKQAMPRVVDLIIESYNLMYHLNVDRFPCPIKNRLLNDIRRAREPLFDEFCLKYDRKWFFERYFNKFEDMSPAQRTQFISYMITTAVGEALVLEFINDMAGLGDLDDIGKKSRIGRWLGKTRGGRKLFKKLRKLHQARRDIQNTLLGYGIPANKVRELAYKLTKGECITTNENMSPRSAKYQEYITGNPANQSFKLNGVKFDGYRYIKGKEVALIEAKGRYTNFVNENGTFKGFFTGQDALVDQAISQVKAAQGIPIIWYCATKGMCEALKKIFEEYQELQHIILIHKAMPK